MRVGSAKLHHCSCHFWPPGPSSCSFFSKFNPWFCVSHCLDCRRMKSIRIPSNSPENSPV